MTRFSKLSLLPGGFLIVALFLPSGLLSAAVIVFFIFCCFRSDRNSIKAQTKILLLPALLYLVYVLCILYSGNPSNGVNIVVRKIPLLILPLGFFILKKEERKKLDYMPVLFVICCLLCTVVCYGNALWLIMEYHSLVNPVGDRQGDHYFFSYHALVKPSGMDPIYLSLYFNVALVIALTTKFIQRNSVRAAIVAYLAVFIILIASKIGILILCVVLPVWALSKIPNRRLALTAIMITVPLTIVIVTQIPFLRERFTVTSDFNYQESDSEKWTSSTFRIAIWSCTAEAIKKSPVWGYGTGGGQDALEEVYHERKFVRGELDHYNAHNEFMNTMLDTGIIGTILMAAMVTCALFISVRRNNDPAIGFILIMTLGFCIETILLRQKGIAFFSVFFGFFISQLSTDTESPDGI